MTTIQVEVTRQDLQDSNNGCPVMCPLARCLRRLSNNKVRAWVFSRTIQHESGERITISWIEDGTKYIGSTNHHKIIEPGIYQIEISDEYMGRFPNV